MEIITSTSNSTWWNKVTRRATQEEPCRMAGSITFTLWGGCCMHCPYLGSGSQPQYFCNFESDNSLLWVCPVYYRMFSSTPGLYRLDASRCPPQLWQPKVSPDIARWPLGIKALPFENHWSSTALSWGRRTVQHQNYFSGNSVVGSSVMPHW